MPWPDKHKGKTRSRILGAAAAAFRSRGISNVGVAEVMRTAGLTHGGFYAHFASKDDLLAEALKLAMEQVEAHLTRAMHNAPAEDRLLAAASSYLSPQHLAHPEQGCPVAALGPELVRGNKRLRQILAEGITRRLGKIRDLISPTLPPEVRREQAAGVLACMLGGLILARSLDKRHGVELLNDCLAFLREALDCLRPHVASQTGDSSAIRSG